MREKVCVKSEILNAKHFKQKEIWRFGDLEIWRFGDLEIWRFKCSAAEEKFRVKRALISKFPNLQITYASASQCLKVFAFSWPTIIM